jgi:hypothetical protein
MDLENFRNMVVSNDFIFANGHDIIRLYNTAENCTSLIIQAKERPIIPVFIYAAFNFSISMIKDQNRIGMDRFKDFCCYFEYAFTEFNYFHNAIEFEDLKLLDDLKVPDFFFQKYCQFRSKFQPINTAEDLQTTLANMYHYHKGSVLFLERKYKEKCIGKNNFGLCVTEIKKIGKFASLNFSSEPSAVYHWRKFVYHNYFNDESDISFDIFLESANKVARRNYIISKLISSSKKRIM